MDFVEKLHLMVQPFEVDFRGKMTLPLVVNNLLNVAGTHADRRGFGIAGLNKEGHTWVLSRLALELTEYPKTDDKVVFETWVEGLMRTFTLRNFAIKKEDGTPIGYARTVWAMIDTTTRKPQNLVGIGLEQYLVKYDCPIERAGKIVEPDGFQESSFTVKYSDVDINQHLNSAKYVEHIVDVFSLHEFSKRDIRRFEIEFIDECFFGETIKVHKTVISETEFVVVLKNEKDEVVCKSRLLFTEQGAEEKYNVGE